MRQTQQPSVQLFPLTIQSGVQKEIPSLTSEPAWRDSDKVRFKSGQPEKIGGWIAHTSGLNALKGTPRSIITWRTNTGLIMTAVGTNEKLYLVTETAFDITPLRNTQVVLKNKINTVNASAIITIDHTAHGFTNSDQIIINHATDPDFVDTEVNTQHIITFINPNSYSITVATASTATNNGVGGTLIHITHLPVVSNPFDTVINNSILTVHHLNHGANNGDYVTFFNATSTSFTDSSVNTNHQITKIDKDSYTVVMGDNASATTLTTGSNVAFAYELHIGNNSAVPNFGWGAGGWGLEAWGTARSISSEIVDIRFWSIDHFGEDLIATHEGGRIYHWAFDSAISNRAELIPTSPLFNNTLLITNPDRHLVSFASEELGFQDKMLVRWADQETFSDWSVLAENTAGSQILSGGSEILKAERSQNTTLIWTDGGLYSMQFIGPPFTFGFDEIGRNCGAISKNAIATYKSVSYWMGSDDFFIYDGVVRTMPSTVHRHVFTRINRTQASKVTAGLIKRFHEVIWFYPTVAGGKENSDYVVYNYRENIWYTGTMVRTAWLDSELNDYPIALTSDGTIFIHENGTDDNGAAISAYIESAEFDLGEGDHFLFISRLIPDMTIVSGTVNYIFKTRQYPHAAIVTDTILPVTPTTHKIDTRIRTRQTAIRIESTGIGDEWRMGKSRLTIRPSGRRS